MEEQQKFGAYYDDVTDDRSLWDKIWYDEEGDIVIWQWPNIWLIAWAAVNFVALIAPRGIVPNVAWWLGFALLTIWAIREITKGVNYFWRFIGVVVLLANIAMAIHGGF